MRWFVAADDRWHVPADETAVRQRRVDGTPVVETRVRVPDGDAVQRVWSVADGGGLTVIEIENESSRPFAVAFSGGGLLTERPPADVPIHGIDLPDDTIVLPVGHRSSVRVAIAHVPTAGTHGAAADAARPSTAVVSGWLDRVRAAEPLRAARRRRWSKRSSRHAATCCSRGRSTPTSDPLGFLFDVAQLVRLGDGADAWLPEIVEPVARIASGRRSSASMTPSWRSNGWRSSAGDRRAANDLPRSARTPTT